MKGSGKVITFKKLFVTIKAFLCITSFKALSLFLPSLSGNKETEIELFGRNLLEKLEKTIKILQLQYAASPIKSRVINFYTADKGNGTDNSSLPGLSMFGSIFSTIGWDQLRRIRQQG